MKKLTYLIWIVPMLITFGSCENDIQLINKNQDKTYVVFGLLNSTDPLQQVKIRMTSITDAALLDIAADSTEFSASPDLQVTIQEWQNDFYATFPLKPVQYPKEPGIFMNTRNDLYETMITPSKDMSYKLMIVNPDNGDLITSKVVPVPVPKLGSPNWSWVRYNFSLPSDPFNIRFYEVPRTNVYLIRFTLHYIEVFTAGDTLVRSNSFVLRPIYVDDPPEYSAKHDNLGNEHNRHMTKGYTYNVFDELIADNDAVNFRQLICFEVSVWGGDENLRNYTELGIKFTDNRKQYFSNINNGIGFFGACSHVDCTGVLPDQDFMDSLPLYSRTSHLKFKTELFKTTHVPAPLSSGQFFSLIREIRYEE
ncbi:MAG: hypothetical protein WC699_09190 [Bacteroidales bacterium]|jgi:hypothetical protein